MPVAIVGTVVAATFVTVVVTSVVGAAIPAVVGPIVEAVAGNYLQAVTINIRYYMRRHGCLLRNLLATPHEVLDMCPLL